MATREEKIEVKVTGADKGAADLEKMAGTAKVAGESVKGMGHEADKASKGVDELGDEAKQTASQLEKLERQVLEAKTALKALGDEYAKTADADIAKEFDKQSSALAKMEGRLKSIAKLNKELAPKDKELAPKDSGGGPVRAVENLLDGRGRPGRHRRGGGLLNGLFDNLSSLGQNAQKGISSAGDFLGDKLGDLGPMGALKLGVGVSAAPAALSLAGSALLAGGALAGVGLGIGGAIANNPEPFRKAWASAVEDVSKRWQRASAGFEAPALAAFGEIKHAVDGIHLEQMLKAAQGYVEPLARGIAGFITPLGNGIAQLTEKAGPVVAVLAKDLPEVGYALEKAFSDIGDGSDGAAAALNDLFGYISVGIVITGKLIEGSEKLYGALHKLVPLFDDGSKKSGEMTGHLVFMNKATDDSSKSTDTLTVAQNALSDAMKQVSDDLSSQLNDLLALDKANDAAATGTDRLKEAFRENGRAIDGSSQAAQKNRAVLQDVVGDYLKQRDAAVAAGDGSAVSIAKANGVLRQHLEELRAILVAHHDDTSAIDKYIDELDSMDGRVVRVKVNVDYQSYNPGIALGNLLHHAGGRSASAPAGFAVVGENGPELAYFNQGDRVWSNGQSQAMLSPSGAGARGGGGGGAYPALPPMSVLEQALAAVVLKLYQDGRLTVPAAAVR